MKKKPEENKQLWWFWLDRTSWDIARELETGCFLWKGGKIVRVYVWLVNGCPSMHTHTHTHTQSECTLWTGKATGNSFTPAHCVISLICPFFVLNKIFFWFYRAFWTIVITLKVQTKFLFENCSAVCLYIEEPPLLCGHTLRR